ncbi:hypothetical protein SeMB42_g01811 [Synchytrium endobioticum]|uniref:T-complex-associated testis-expressed protein 1 n=1 Tax=Synchytrium endobioticum TaxID=286115 RepID=A0A507DDM7_9FUNG|nr:hypothetical protein SeLEV6574_g01511 [Synchytrium endobioticum]TPX51771.1 hypothetical protein SeMB42_g01811 [Synchytrium endobioticum]
MADATDSSNIMSRSRTSLGAVSSSQIALSNDRRASHVTAPPNMDEPSSSSTLNDAANASPGKTASSFSLGGSTSYGAPARKAATSVALSNAPTTIPHTIDTASELRGNAESLMAGGSNDVALSSNDAGSKTSLVAKTVVIHGSRTALAPDRANRAGSAHAAPGIDFEQDGAEWRDGERRIISEDPHFNPAPVAPLVDLCLHSVVQNFEAKPRLDKVPQKYRQRLLEAISLELPLTLAAPLISEESYWGRRARHVFKTIPALRYHGNSWKRLFFELYVREQIENFVPSVSLPAGPALGATDEKPRTVDNGATAAIEPNLVRLMEGSAPWIQNLEIRQLKPKPHADGKRDDGVASEHLDLNVVFAAIPALQSLSLTYDVRDIGMGFTWSAFGISLVDCERLAAGLKGRMRCLHTLVLRTSRLDDHHARILCHALLDSTPIKHLDLSNNRIGDAGARGLAKVLASQQNSGLCDLVLGNNRIGQIGAHSLGRCFTKNRTLQSLSLRLNRLGDVGAADFLDALCHAYHYANPEVPGRPMLATLDMSGNGLATLALAALCTMVKSNVRCLRSVDVSANSLARPLSKGHDEGVIITGSNAAPTPNVNPGAENATVHMGISAQAAKEKQELEDAGKLIVDAVSKNQYLTRLDLRATEIPSTSVLSVQEVIAENAATV